MKSLNHLIYWAFEQLEREIKETEMLIHRKWQWNHYNATNFWVLNSFPCFTRPPMKWLKAAPNFHLWATDLGSGASKNLVFLPATIIQFLIGFSQNGSENLQLSENDDDGIQTYVNTLLGNARKRWMFKNSAVNNASECLTSLANRQKLQHTTQTSSWKLYILV